MRCGNYLVSEKNPYDGIRRKNEEEKFAEAME
jgi:hypothetical protein